MRNLSSLYGSHRDYSLVKHLWVGYLGFFLTVSEWLGGARNGSYGFTACALFATLLFFLGMDALMTKFLYIPLHATSLFPVSLILNFGRELGEIFLCLWMFFDGIFVSGQHSLYLEIFPLWFR